MRLSAGLLVVAGAGGLFGAWLIALWVVGLVVIVESVGVAAFALLRDDGRKPEPPRIQTLEDVLDRARRAS